MMQVSKQTINVTRIRGLRRDKKNYEILTQPYFYSTLKGVFCVCRYYLNDTPYFLLSMVDVKTFSEEIVSFTQIHNLERKEK